MARHSKKKSGGGPGILGGIGVGAALMYFLDPGRGRRRRHLVRDKLAHAGHVTGSSVGATSRDVKNRVRGMAAGTRSRLSRDGADDVVIAERVRSALGRAVSHPGAITVSALDGVVTLGGPVLAREADRLLNTARKVRGVREVENRLEVHESGDGISALQGGSTRSGDRPEMAQENWTPAVRLFSGAAGGLMALYGARRRDGVGSALGVAGLTLAARGMTNMSARRLTGVGAGRRSVDVRKTITIHAPVERVFEHFSQWENWPSWMTHVREVRRSGTVGGDERTHWVVDGPAGVPVSWNAITTKFVPNEVIAWKSVEGEGIRHAGMVRFNPTDDGLTDDSMTTVDVQMSYNPPAGAIGHMVAGLLGRDPRHQMNDDLARLKTMIESGRPPHDAARPASGRLSGESMAER